MNPLLHAISVVKGQVNDLDERYDRYHADLVNKLVEIISKQEAGLSDQKRRAEVADIVTTFGSAVAAHEKG